MGLLGNIMKSTIGHVGNWTKNALNTATGGTAGILGSKMLNMAHKHSGLLGKVIGGIGRNFLNENTRNTLSKAADVALKYIPEGKVKETLSKINNSAKENDISQPDISKSQRNKYKNNNSVTTPGLNSFEDMVHTVSRKGRI